MENLGEQWKLDADFNALIRSYHNSRARRIAACFSDYPGKYTGYLKTLEISRWFEVLPRQVDWANKYYNLRRPGKEGNKIKKESHSNENLNTILRGESQCNRGLHRSQPT